MVYLYLLYFIVVAVFAAYSAAAIYHLSRFGFVGDLTKKVIFLYSALSIAVIIVSLFLLILGLGSGPESLN